MFDFYFQTKRFEGNGKFYKWIGVLLFRKLAFLVHGAITKSLRMNVFDYPNNYRLWEHSEKCILRFEKYTRMNEAIHLVAIIPIILPMSFNFFIHNVHTPIFILQIIGLILNFEAIFLQRYNRIRLTRVIKRKERIKKKHQNDVESAMTA